MLLKFINKMIPDDEHITIYEIQTLAAKDRNMTLTEKDTLDSYYSILPKTQGIYDSSTQKTTPFTRDQEVFVKYGLLPLIRYNVPRLHEVLAIYNMTIDSIFEWQDTSHYCGSIMY